ncbi:MAG: PilZ domain-containing protein [Phycisphaeraceae bacterium]|nr:PilZ domain-containing protein [Phycisphaeraceae bacterium]
MSSINRRRYERFALMPMYTAIRVRLLSEERFTREGHAYDISEGGARFELDDPIEPGTPVAMEILIPGLDDGPNLDLGSGRAVQVHGNVVWTNADDLPGPVRMAIVFTRFVEAGDRERLMRRLVTGAYARAA